MSHPISAVNKHPRLAQRAAFIAWSHEQVRWSDTDLVGHVNNLSFAAYLETGRSLFLREFVEKDSPRRAMMLPAQMVLNFYREAHWPDVVDIGTAVLSLGNTSCRVGQGLFVGDHCIATSEATLVLIDEHTRQPITLYPWLRDWLGQRMLIE